VKAELHILAAAGTTGLTILGGLLTGALHVEFAMLAAELGVVAGPLGDSLGGLAGAVAGMPLAIPMALLGIAATIAASSGGLIAQVLLWLKVHVVDPMLALAQQGAGWVFEQLGQLTSGDPEVAPRIALGLTLAALPLGMAAHALAVAAEHTHPIKTIGYGTMARELVAMTDLQKISDATIGGAIDVAIGQPMRYWLARRIRYRVPDSREALDLLTSRHISEGDARLSGLQREPDCLSHGGGVAGALDARDSPARGRWHPSTRLAAREDPTWRIPRCRR
jgi:hypothetical protein